MSEDPILDELYAVRSQLQQEHGSELSAYLHGEFERLKREGHPVARIQQRTIRCTGAAKSDGLERDNQASPPRDR